jgi:hypothetical protein
MITEERINQELQIFFTNSGLPPEPIMSDLTIAAARDTIPRMLDVMLAATRMSSPVVPVHDFSHPSSAELGALFHKYRSDKSTHHNYHILYASILGPRRDEQLALLEIGLGTNNTDVVSNMGVDAKPGSSLRAWRDYLPKASIFGADVDKRVLFTEERIQTFYVDQTQPHTFDAMGMPTLDIVIDDGLHSTHANFATLAWALGKVRVGGWIVIEDIRQSSLPAWHMMALALPRGRFRSQVVSADHGFLFVVEKT